MRYNSKTQRKCNYGQRHQVSESIKCLCSVRACKGYWPKRWSQANRDQEYKLFAQRTSVLGILKLDRWAPANREWRINRRSVSPRHTWSRATVSSLIRMPVTYLVAGSVGSNKKIRHDEGRKSCFNWPKNRVCYSLWHLCASIGNNWWCGVVFSSLRYEHTVISWYKYGQYSYSKSKRGHERLQAPRCP